MRMLTGAETTARTVAELAHAGRFAELERLFAAPLRKLIDAGAVRAAWTGAIAERGPVTGIGEPATEQAGPGPARVSVPVTGEGGGLAVVVAVDADGLLHDLRLTALTPPWEPPPYADPAAFAERDVVIGDGPLAVPGTLTLPRGPGPASLPSGPRPRPGVVLLSGGGPFDRDATSGANKPLKDLAWGLATRGIAVARFDKATHVHAAAELTMTGEYVPYATAAVRLLRDEPGVDPDRVFVLGHSMGGKVAPRVAEAEPAVAGLVIMAGDTQPMHEAAVRVVRHLASLDPGPDMDAAVEMITRQAEAVADPALSPSAPARSLLFGLPAPYWLELRGYDPVATAAALERPMLILQGGRDYQVTVEHDLAGWRAGLGHRPDVTIRVFDADDHLFFPGTGPSTPAGYEPAQHVDPAVVADVAAWIGG
ncbi:alpha/beta hydrolase [Nonomuraea sp. NPDC049725]|uniref:alpha/beta hydrolase family protein n=1 Tax=Nonomuraea sp. NPDC049725 TaxID=3154508 RepID=UPI0034377CA7